MCDIGPGVVFHDVVIGVFDPGRSVLFLGGKKNKKENLSKVEN